MLNTSWDSELAYMNKSSFWRIKIILVHMHVTLIIYSLGFIIILTPYHCHMNNITLVLIKLFLNLKHCAQFKILRFLIFLNLGRVVYGFTGGDLSWRQVVLISIPTLMMNKIKQRRHDVNSMSATLRCQPFKQDWSS